MLQGSFSRCGADGDFSVLADRDFKNAWPHSRKLFFANLHLSVHRSWCFRLLALLTGSHRVFEAIKKARREVIWDMWAR